MKPKLYSFFSSNLLLLLSFIFVSSCLQQTPPQVKSDIEKTQDEQIRLRDCQSVQLESGLLEKENLVNFFRCTRWESDFPALYKAIQEIPKKSWNHIFIPYDNVFLTPKERRKNLFRGIHKLDENGALEDLDPIFTALFTNFGKGEEETNIILLLDKLLSAPAEKPAGIPYSMSLTEENIKNLLKLLNLPRRDLEFLAKTFISLTEPFGPLEVDFKASMRELLLEGPELEPRPGSFRYERARFISVVLFTLASKEPGHVEKILIPRILATQNSAKRPWLYDWIRDPGLSFEKFDKLSRFSFEQYPNLTNDMRGLSYYFPTGVTCRLEGEKGPLKINLKRKFQDYILKLANSPVDEFFDYALDTTNELLLAEASCELGSFLLNPPTANGRADILAVIENLNDLFADEHYYTVTKYLNQVLTSPSTQNPHGFPLYLIEFLSGDLFEGLNRLNKASLDGKKEPITRPLYRYLRALPASLYFDLSEVMKLAMRDDIRVLAKDLDAIWVNLSSVEREFLFNLTDLFFYEDINLGALLEFFRGQVTELPLALNELSAKLSSDESKRTETVVSLREIINKINQDEVRDDLRRFFSRDHIIEVLRILGGGQLEAEGQAEKKSDGQSHSPEIYPVNYVSLPTAEERQVQREAAVCIRRLSQIGNFYSAVQQLPPECMKPTINSFSLRLLGWLSTLNGEYTRHFGEEYVLLDEKGLLGKEGLFHSMPWIKILDEVIEVKNQNGDVERGFPALIGTAKEHLLEIKLPPNLSGLEKVGSIGQLEDLLGVLVKFGQDKESKEDEYIDLLIKDFLDLEDDVLIALANDFANILDDFRASTFEQVTYLQKKTCQEYFALTQLGISDPLKFGYGVDPCPSKETIKSTIRRIITSAKLIHKDDDQEVASPPFLESLLALVHPSGGLRIPFEQKASSQISYIIGLDDVFAFHWDMTKHKDQVEFHYDGGSFTSNMDRASQLEVVIRDISFTNNFFGLLFQNETARSKNYAEDTRYNLSWYEKTHLFARTKILAERYAPDYREDQKIPVDTEWKLKNVLNTFRGLHHVADLYQHQGTHNNVPYFFVPRSYKDFMQAFLTLQVMTSGEKARNHQGLWDSAWYAPYPELGLKHNSLIIVDVMNLSAIRNVGRFLRDRISDNEKEFFDFIESEDFKRVDQKLLAKFNLVKLQTSLRGIVDKYTTDENDQVLELSDIIVDWLATLSYDETRHLENAIGNLAVIGTYLGPDDEFPEYKEEFKEIDPNLLLDVLEPVLKSWTNIKDHWPVDVSVAQMIPTVEKLAQFFKQGLSSQPVPMDERSILRQCPLRTKVCIKEVVGQRRKRYYRALNMGFKALSKVLLNKNESIENNGLHFLLKKFDKDPSGWSSKLKDVIDSTYRYFLGFRTVEDSGNLVASDLRIENLAQNVRNVVNHPYFDLKGIRSYLNVVINPESTHYGEISRLANYVLLPDVSGKTKMEVGVRELLSTENVSALEEFLRGINNLLDVRSP